MSKQIIIYNVNSAPKGIVNLEQLIDICKESGFLFWDSRNPNAKEPIIVDSVLGVEFGREVTMHDVAYSEAEITGEAEEIDGKYFVPESKDYPEYLWGKEVATKEFKFNIHAYYGL